jgi:hypothetical protein
MRRHLGRELADRRALALEGCVELAVAGGLGLAKGGDREGNDESSRSGSGALSIRFSAPYRSSATVLALMQMEDEQLETTLPPDEEAIAFGAMLSGESGMNSR